MDRNRFRPLAWIAGAIFIFALLYASSYLALHWMPPYEGMDMSSQLTADYSPWAFLVFQPVDPAILEEIKQERGLPGKIVIDDEGWSTPLTAITIPTIVHHSITTTPQPTMENPNSSPSSVPATMTSFPNPTVSVSADSTPTPTQSAVPTKRGKNPKTHKTPKPRPDRPNN